MKTVKLLASIILLVGISGCWTGKYQSKTQAETACKEWREKGNVIIIGGKSYPQIAILEFGETLRLGSNKRNSRRCWEEDETSQFLGYESKPIQSGIWKSGDKKEEWKIVKHFRY